LKSADFVEEVGVGGACAALAYIVRFDDKTF
jgi:hypothetical protein